MILDSLIDTGINLVKMQKAGHLSLRPLTCTTYSRYHYYLLVKASCLSESTANLLLSLPDVVSVKYISN